METLELLEEQTQDLEKQIQVNESLLPFKLEKKGHVIQIIAKKQKLNNKTKKNKKIKVAYPVIELQLFDRDEVLSFRNVEVKVIRSSNSFVIDCIKERIKYFRPFK